MKLLEPYTFNNGKTVKNRLVVAPMTHWASDENGHATQAELDYIRPRAQGFGMFVTAATAVNRQGRAFVGEPNAITEADVPSLKQVAQTIQSQGALAILQLQHGGKEAIAEATQGREAVAPSADGRAREMTAHEIAQTIADFARATRLAVAAGFDGVEIHGANNYLLQQFLSAKHNRRSDEWGGSLEKRLRFPLAVTDAVQAAAGEAGRSDFIVGYRTTPEESGELGLSMTDTFALADALVARKIQYLHISLQDFYNKARRGADTQQSRLQLLHQRLHGSGVALIGVGKLHTPKKAAKAFATGWVDFAAIGLGVLANPDFAKLIAEGRPEKARAMLNLSRDATWHNIPEPMWNKMMTFIPKPVLKAAAAWRSVRNWFSR